MSRLRAWIRSFFGFSRTETNAFLILLPLLVVVIFSEPIYRSWFVQQPHDFNREKNALDSLIATWNWSQRDSSVTINLERELFSFDPNIISKEELVDLG